MNVNKDQNRDQNKDLDMDADNSSIKSSESSKNKSEWLTKLLQKTIKFIQSEQNKKYIHVFLIDPVINHILERVFPYVLILSVLFTILTCMVTITMIVVFTRVPIALGTTNVVR
jgi:hypothetical protein